MEKLKFKQIMSLTLTLFAIFFGAGNMVFPPAMGQLAGENYWQALIGFILTDAGIALLGIIAVVLVGNEITDLGKLYQSLGMPEGYENSSKVKKEKNTQKDIVK